MLVGGNSIGMVELTIRCCSSGSRILVTIDIVDRIGLRARAACWRRVVCFSQMAQGPWFT